MEYTYSGFENRISAEHLQAGEVCKITGIGNSMTPILKSRQPVICIPVTEETILNKKDIVLCKVKGHYYLHLIYAIKNDRSTLFPICGDKFSTYSRHMSAQATRAPFQLKPH